MDRKKILTQIIEGDFETNNKEEQFLKSLIKSNHLEYLTEYTLDELSEFELYKIRNQDIGFAFTEDKEIISVYNNTGVHNLGKELICKAVELGGEKVFHFDGWLTGFYSKLKFIENKKERIQWDDRFAPKNWNYSLVDIFDVNTSVYAQEILDKIHSSKIIFLAMERYSQGKPDLITRYVKR